MDVGEISAGRKQFSEVSEKVNVNNLIIRCRTDKNSLEILYNLFKKGVFAIALSIVNDYQLAEDCVAETFIRLTQVKRFSEKNGDGKVFIYKIARNVALEQYRKFQKSSVNIVIQSYGEADNRYVRVYTKLLINDVIKTTDLGLYKRFYRTNQIYLVEYEDYYDENNIISIIDSDAKFNHDDIEECMNQNIHEFDLYINEVNHDFLDIINMNFLSDDKDTISLMFKENKVTASSFVYKSFYKLNGKIYPMLTDTLLLNLSNNYSYSYEIRCSYIENDGKISDFDTSWLVNQWNKIGCKYNNRVSKLKENDNFIKFSEKGMNLKSDEYICEYLPTTLAKNTFYYLKNDEEIATEYVIPYFACQFSAYGFESDSVSGLIKSSIYYE